jgi:nicotinamidase-related amidase
MSRADNSEYDDEKYFQDYLRLYGLKSEHLFRGEEKSIRFAARDYKTPRLAFEIKKNECALIVVDMQNDFVMPGSPIWIPESTRQVPKIKHLIVACRELRIPVIYTAHTVSPDCAGDFYEFSEPIRRGAVREGSHGADICFGLHPRRGERIVTAKHSYSAMLGTDLDYVLRNQDVRTVLVCGTVTNFCVDSTARDAFGLGYHVVIISDCCSSDNPYCHQATMDTFRCGWARVLTEEELVKVLWKGDRASDRRLLQIKTTPTKTKTNQIE